MQSAAFLILAMMAQLSVADEFWAIPQVRGKGDDYLFVVDPAKAKQFLQKSCDLGAQSACDKVKEIQ